ncbi:endonuclease/exonuclease/phosphatase family protein [Saccharopolyspora shandongensis]|uniref:endonuclease/exonuclease/phosphatase family protein n=1 Tax=Saccharopolyspora shandongensis TaxID=418495 RepID=UPI0033DA74BA
MRSGKRSKARLATVAVAASALSMVALTGVAPAAESASGKIHKNRVMTWNTNGQLSEDATTMAEQIARVRPQLVALQETCHDEAWWTQQLLRKKGLNYEISFGPAAANYLCGEGHEMHGQVILSAAPIREDDNVYYDEDEGFLEVRGYQVLATEVAGKQVRVFNTHLTASSNDPEENPERKRLRTEQVRQLVREANRHDRALVFGDFNAQPWDSEMGPMFSRFTDADANCRPIKNSGCNPTHLGSKKKFDYIFLHGVTSKHIEFHTSNPRDHRIFVSDLR